MKNVMKWFTLPAIVAASLVASSIMKPNAVIILIAAAACFGAGMALGEILTIRRLSKCDSEQNQGGCT